MPRASPPLGLNGDSPGCPAGPFFGAGLPTPGPAPTVAHSDTAPDLGRPGPQQSSQRQKKVSTPGIRGACRGSILHGSLPVEALILPGLPQKMVIPFNGGELHQPQPALGTVGVPVGANGGDALINVRTPPTHNQLESSGQAT